MVESKIVFRQSSDRPFTNDKLDGCTILTGTMFHCDLRTYGPGAAVDLTFDITHKLVNASVAIPFSITRFLNSYVNLCFFVFGYVRTVVNRVARGTGYTEDCLPHKLNYSDHNPKLKEQKYPELKFATLICRRISRGFIPYLIQEILITALERDTSKQI